MPQQGKLVDQKVLVKALKKIFEGDPKTLQDFTAAMAKALMHCKRSSCSITSGSKTSAAVVRVARAWAKHCNLPKSDESSSGPEFVEEVVDESEDEDRNAADRALVQAKAMFSGTKGLKRNASVASVASSVEEKPKALPKALSPAVASQVHYILHCMLKKKKEIFAS